MLQITATELRTHLFEYLQRVEHGESIQIKLNGRGLILPFATI